MNGRLENENKINLYIDSLLAKMPEYVTDWHNNLVSSDKTAATRKDYVAKIYNFMTYLSDDPMDLRPRDISEREVTSYYNSLKKKDLDINGRNTSVETSVSYRLSIWYCLHNFFGYLCKRGLMSFNYMDLIDKPKDKNARAKKEKEVYLTEEDFAAILKEIESDYHKRNRVRGGFNLKSRDLCILYIFMVTGMRRTALSEINVEDINLTESKLIVIDKGGIIQEYYINDKVAAVIQQWITDRESLLGRIDAETSALFVNKDGGRLSGTSIYKLVEKYCMDALGRNVSPHKLRAGFCSILYNKTGDIEFVRRVVGHSNIATTQRYIVTKGDERKQASSIISSLLEKS